MQKINDARNPNNQNKNKTCVQNKEELSDNTLRNTIVFSNSTQGAKTIQFSTRNEEGNKITQMRVAKK